MKFLSLLLVSLSLFELIWLQTQSEAPKSEICKTRVLIINCDWNNPDKYEINKLSSEQVKWWLKEGQKKFKNVCLATNLNEADYVIAWAEKWEDRTYEYSVPKTQTTQHSGTINTTSTGSSGTTNTTGTYSGTSTTTTSEKAKTEYSIQFVAASVHKTVETDGKKEVVKMPVYVTDHKGQWRWSKPDKDALLNSLKYLSRQK